MTLTKEHVSRINRHLQKVQGWTSAEGLVQDIEAVKLNDRRTIPSSAPIFKVVENLHGTGWQDHPDYEIKDGVRTYIFNPYVLHMSDFESFLKLQDAGWSVVILGRSDYVPNALQVRVT